MKHFREYVKDTPPLPDWRITCICVDKRHRGKGVAWPHWRVRSTRSPEPAVAWSRPLRGGTVGRKALGRVPVQRDSACR